MGYVMDDEDENDNLLDPPDDAPRDPTELMVLP